MLPVEVEIPHHTLIKCRAAPYEMPLLQLLPFPESLLFT